MSDFFRDLAGSIKDADTSIVADGLGSAEFEGYVDTGCYMLNAVMSGSLYGGLASNKITGLAGENSTGKCARGSEKLVVYMTKETKSQLNL